MSREADVELGSLRPAASRPPRSRARYEIASQDDDANAFRVTDGGLKLEVHGASFYALAPRKRLLRRRGPKLGAKLLANVSFHVAPGEMCALMGHSGAGADTRRPLTFV